MTKVRIGYARVSTTSQSLEIQVSTLNSAGCVELFTDFATSGEVNFQAEGYLALMARVQELAQEGKAVEVCVTKLDRFGRSLRELIDGVHLLGKQGISFTAVDDSFTYDATSPMSELTFSMLGAFAQFERSLIRQRMQEGRAAKAAKGMRFGRRPALTQAAVDAIHTAYADGDGKTPGQLSKEWGVSRMVIGRVLGIYPSQPPYVTADEWDEAKKLANSA